MLATWQQMLGAFICGALFGGGVIAGVVRHLTMRDDTEDRVAEEQQEENAGR